MVWLYKGNAKVVLTKHFVEDIDYKVLELESSDEKVATKVAEATLEYKGGLESNGGLNKQNIFLQLQPLKNFVLNPIRQKRIKFIIIISS